MYAEKSTNSFHTKRKTDVCWLFYKQFLKKFYSIFRVEVKIWNDEM